MSANTQYAKMTWCPQDIINMAKDWHDVELSTEEAEALLARHQEVFVLLLQKHAAQEWKSVFKHDDWFAEQRSPWVRPRVEMLDRAEVVWLLESYGPRRSDGETLEDLREELITGFLFGKLRLTPLCSLESLRKRGGRIGEAQTPPPRRLGSD